MVLGKTSAKGRQMAKANANGSSYEADKRGKPEEDLPLEDITKYLPTELKRPMTFERLEAVPPFTLERVKGHDPQKERLARLIKALRGVTRENPEGQLSMRLYGTKTGLDQHTIRGYEIGQSHFGNLQDRSVLKLAALCQWSEPELRAYIRGVPYKPEASPLSICSTIRVSSLEDIVLYQEVIAYRLRQILEGGERLQSFEDEVEAEDDDIEEQEPSFPEGNQQIIDWIEEFAEQKGWDEQRLNTAFDLYGIKNEEIAALHAGELLSVDTVGLIASLIGKSVDELVKVRSLGHDDAHKNNGDTDDNGSPQQKSLV